MEQTEDITSQDVEPSLEQVEQEIRAREEARIIRENLTAEEERSAVEEERYKERAPVKAYREVVYEIKEQPGNEEVEIMDDQTVGQVFNQYTEQIQFSDEAHHTNYLESQGITLAKQSRPRLQFHLPFKFFRWLFHKKSSPVTKNTRRMKSAVKLKDYAAKSMPMHESESLDLDQPKRDYATKSKPRPAASMEQKMTESVGQAVSRPILNYNTKSAPSDLDFDQPQYATKSMPLYSKSAPTKSKMAMPRPKQDLVAKALEETSKAPVELSSTAFSTTRFAVAWEKWAKMVGKELEDFAEQVRQDSVNGYAWTLFAKTRRYDPDSSLTPTFFKIKDFSADQPQMLDAIPPVLNGDLIVEHDSETVDHFKFHIHKSFVPSVIAQKIPKISRVGWGSFICGVEVFLRLNNGQICALRFDHLLYLQENAVGTSESTYYVDVNGEKFVVQLGNTFGMIDSDQENQEDAILAGIAKNRAARQLRLQKTQSRLEEVRKSQVVIDDFVSGCEKQKLGLGAVIAAILNGREMSKESFQSLYNHGVKTVRCVVLDSDTIPSFEKFLVGGTALGTELDAFDVSRDASGLSIDRFVSHSWFDDARQKCDTILQWNKEFQEKHGRPARIWCDKFCLRQTSEDLKASVPCLPIYLLACDRVLLLKTATFLSRLWCLTEIYTNFIMGSSSSTDKGFEVIHLDKESLSATSTISVGNAKCSFKDDEDALRTNFDRAPGGILQVELALNEAMKL